MAETFDTLQAAHDLASSGIEREHAEAIAKAIRQGQGELATKTDLKAGLAEFKAEIKSDLTSQQRWFVTVLLASQALLFTALVVWG